MFNREKIIPAGKCELKMIHPRTGKKYKGQFVVMSDTPISILGARSSQQMGLVKVDEEPTLKINTPEMKTPLQMEDILRDYTSVFSKELGCFPSELHLKVNPAITPVQLPIRRTPISLKGKLKGELDRLESIGVISRIEEPTEWVSSLVVTPKPNGTLHVCLDPKLLNRGLKRSHYSMSALDDVLPQLTRSKVFSHADVRNRFCHINMLVNNIWNSVRAISMESYALRHNTSTGNFPKDVAAVT